MPKLIDYPAVVVVWTQDGCPACEAFVPKFRPLAERYAPCVPSVIVRADDFPAAADAYRVRSTPTTMVLRYGRRGMRSIEGDGDQAVIEGFFQYAMRNISGCEL